MINKTTRTLFNQIEDMLDIKIGQRQFVEKYSTDNSPDNKVYLGVSDSTIIQIHCCECCDEVVVVYIEDGCGCGCEHDTRINIKNYINHLLPNVDVNIVNKK